MSSDRKSISDKDWKILLAESGGTCAFPGCPNELVQDKTGSDTKAFVGEIAHIVGSSRTGPRGQFELTDDDRNKHPNLLLLCSVHHHVIDSQVHHYSVPVLLQMKEDQKRRNRKAKPIISPTARRTDKLFSTLLRVTHLPRSVFVAPSKFAASEQDELKQAIRWPDSPSVLVPYVQHGGQIYAFHNLKAQRGPFADIVERDKTAEVDSKDFWDGGDGERLFVRLLNRSLYKFTDRRNIRYDPFHRRFYFPVFKPGEERSEQYTPLNLASQTVSVAWSPITKATGENKPYWLHKAARLKYHRMGHAWFLSIRPERNVTKDGEAPYNSKQIGRLITKIKAKMYNHGYLTEVHFWKDYLSKSKPHIVQSFGAQSIIIDSSLQTLDIDWPGIDGDDKEYRNQQADEDLFSYLELQQAIQGFADDDQAELANDMEDEFEEDAELEDPEELVEDVG